MVYVGVIVVIVSRALLATVDPVLAAQKSLDRIGALASMRPGLTLALAAGAFFGLVGVVEIGYAISYALLAILSAVGRGVALSKRQAGLRPGFNSPAPASAACRHKAGITFRRQALSQHLVIQIGMHVGDDGAARLEAVDP